MGGNSDKRIPRLEHDSKSVKVWNAKTGVVEQNLTGHADFVWTVAWSPDGLHLASGSYDNTIKIWTASTGVCTGTLQGHTKLVSSVAWSPDGWHLASGSHDR